MVSFSRHFLKDTRDNLIEIRREKLIFNWNLKYIEIKNKREKERGSFQTFIKAMDAQDSDYVILFPKDDQ